MMKKVKPSHIIAVLFMILIAIIALMPFWLMIVMGTYRTADVYTRLHLWFGNYFGPNFAKVLKINFFAFFRNSAIVSSCSAFLCVSVSCMAGYAFAKYRFKGSKMMFNFILGTMMIPGQLGLVAFIIMVRNLGWMSTWWPLIIPSAASAFGVFWMRQFIISAVPQELIDSARIDGSTELNTFLRIAVPLISPAFMTLGLLTFLWSWNDFLRPMLILENEALFTIPLGIKRMTQHLRQDIGATILGLSIGTIPILFIFSLFSNTLIAGLTSGSIKE